MLNRRPDPTALWLIALVTAALLLRLLAATDDFWLDEIFTYFVALAQLERPADLFRAIAVEHQPLVTLTFHLLGDRPDWLLYRLPSVVAGSGTIALIAIAGRRRMGRTALVATLAVATVSYPLVVYASEARGYAPAAFFSLAMALLLERWLETKRPAALIGFWLSSVTAFLYHPAAIGVYAALALWSLLHGWRTGPDRLRRLREQALAHAPPVAFLLWFWFAVIRTWGSVGGDILPLSRVVGDTMAALVGLPMLAPFRPGALVLGFGLLAAGLLVQARLVRSDRWLFHLLALLVFPALMLVASGRPYVYVRYFVILFPFFYLLLGETLDAAARRWRWARIAAVGLFTLLLVGNGIATADFLRVGRGGYLEAVRSMAAETGRAEVRVGGDHDFRNGLPILFYDRYLPAERSVVYLPVARWPAEGPDWFIVHNTCGDAGTFVPAERIAVAGRRFSLVRSYPVLGLSGVGWHLYRPDTGG